MTGPPAAKRYLEDRLTLFARQEVPSDSRRGQTEYGVAHQQLQPSWLRSWRLWSAFFSDI